MKAWGELCSGKVRAASGEWGRACSTTGMSTSRSGAGKSSVLLVAALCVYSVDAVSPFLLSVSWGRDPALYSSGN